MRERVDDLPEAQLHRKRAAARLVLRGQVDRCHTAIDRDAEQSRPARHGSRRAGSQFSVGWAGEQRLERSLGDPLRRSVRPQRGFKPAAVREPDFEGQRSRCRR